MPANKSFYSRNSVRNVVLFFATNVFIIGLGILLMRNFVQIADEKHFSLKLMIHTNVYFKVVNYSLVPQISAISNNLVIMNILNIRKGSILLIDNSMLKDNQGFRVKI